MLRKRLARHKAATARDVSASTHTAPMAPRMTTPENTSVPIIIFTRPTRSASTPPKGARTASGKWVNSMARPMTAADPVASLIQSSMAMSYKWFPNPDTAWPWSTRTRFFSFPLSSFFISPPSTIKKGRPGQKPPESPIKKAPISPAAMGRTNER